MGHFIRNRRMAIGLSLRSAARRLAVDPAHLSRVEAEKTAASASLIRRLADLLACEEDVLLLLAGRLPEDIRAVVETQPFRAASALRNTAALCVAESRAPYGEPMSEERKERAIEDGFPFDMVSEIAEAESWRKAHHRRLRGNAAGNSRSRRRSGGRDSRRTTGCTQNLFSEEMEPRNTCRLRRPIAPNSSMRPIAFRRSTRRFPEHPSSATGSTRVQ